MKYNGYMGTCIETLSTVTGVQQESLAPFDRTELVPQTFDLAIFEVRYVHELCASHRTHL